MNSLPGHLKKYVVEQNYEKYTPVDQAVWRFILRQLRAFLSHHAHESYLEGLEKTGIEIERIPKISEISEKLSRFGWRALPVSGFIPPAAFMELQSLGVLPIASEIRSLDHLLYTPAPDIVHEAAGHAPILINPQFAQYLKQYAQIAKKAILSKQDLDMYEAIRNLSDIKENPGSTETEITAAEQSLEKVSKSITHVSEAAELSRMNWWTAEYGLVGPLDDPKIFGAGLLSSVGESRWCLSAKVKKIPLSVDCVNYSYDITEPQPHLFVTPDFEHLSKVLQDFSKQMAFKVGGLKGINKAVQSAAVNSVELDSGLQITGQVVEVISDSKGKPSYLRLQGPSQLAFQDKEINGHGRSYHSQGFGTPVGCLKQFPQQSPSTFDNAQWKSLGMEFENTEGLQKALQKNDSSNLVILEYLNDVIVTGTLQSRFVQNGKTLIITLMDARAEYKGRVLFEPSWGLYDIAIGSEVTSVFGGPADREKYGESSDFVAARVPPPKYGPETLRRFELYQKVRDLREKKCVGTELSASLKGLVQEVHLELPNNWLLFLEILELAENRAAEPALAQQVRRELLRIAEKNPQKADVIQDGLALVHQL
jgi:phenylalanine-4-hydroxylase